MSENTNIEWADHTFNPWIGCTKVGPGCDNCYAKADFEDRKHRVVWGAGQPRSRTSAANWALPVRWNKRAGIMQSAWAHGVALHGGDESACIAAGFIKPQRPKVFCASLADVFDNEVPEMWRCELWELIESTPNLDWLILTKRIGNARAMMSHMLDRASGWTPPANFWLGATIVNQDEADRDIPKLLAVPAAKRFLSIEPLLGPVDLTPAYLPCPNAADCMCSDFDTGSTECCRQCDHTGIGDEIGIDWVIVGGESGCGARPMHPDWARSLRDQCEAARVPFLFKQWGEWMPGVEEDDKVVLRFPLGSTSGPKNPDWHRWPNAITAKVGKKAAGRLLDGCEWNGLPS